MRRFAIVIWARSSRSISSSFQGDSLMLVLGGKFDLGATAGKKYPSASTIEGACVKGRHLMLSHSLVIARWTPTSSPGFSLISRAASGNQGPGTITLVVVSTPRL